MNKEEFKLRILSQLKDKNSAILTLMFNEGVTFRKYWYKKTFLVKEYNLEMVIETMDDILPTFQVMFKESDPKAKYEHELNLGSFRNETFMKEKLFVEKGQVFFQLETICVTQEDYLFSFTDFGLPKTIKFVMSWSYDLKTGEFSNNQDEKDDKPNGVLLYADTIDGHRKNPIWHYIETMTGNDFMNDLETAMNEAGVPEIRKLIISHIFDNARSTHQSSSLAIILRALQNAQ